MKQLIRSAARGIFHLSGLANYFKGQKAQDKWVILNVLPFKRRGFFLDLAAADGVEGSNSYVLEKLFGWSGICIEPNPAYFDELRKTRRCIADPSVISDKRQTIQFRVDNGQLGGIVASDTDNNAEIRGDQLSGAKILDLQAVPLIDVLRRHNAPKVIDYFSLDVEGCEERIIGSFDFDQYTFRCLTIERPTPKVNEVLFANGYLFVKNDRFDSFYIHSSLAECRRIERQPFEQVPKKTW